MLTAQFLVRSIAAKENNLRRIHEASCYWPRQKALMEVQCQVGTVCPAGRLSDDLGEEKRRCRLLGEAQGPLGAFR